MNEQIRKYLLGETANALNKVARVRQDLKDRKGQPPQPGDLFGFAKTSQWHLEWVVAKRDSKDQRRLLVVPADTHSFLGPVDLEVSADADCGPLSLRCKHTVWLTEDNFDLEMRTGRLEPKHLSALQQHLETLDLATISGSHSIKEADTPFEHQEWEEELTKAQTELAAHTRASQHPSQAVSLWGRLSQPLGIAASILLVLSLTFGAGLLWQRGRIIELEEHKQLVEAGLPREPILHQPQSQLELESIRQRVAQLQQERIRETRTHHNRILELERLLEQARRQKTLVNLPLAWLAPRESVRGEQDALSLPSDAQSLLLILEVRDPRPHRLYRLRILRDKSQTTVWNRSGLKKTGLIELPVVLPTSLLPPGDYRLVLSDQQAGQADTAVEYFLSIKKR